MVTNLANPTGGGLLKQYGGISSGGAHDGVSSWGIDFTGNTFRVDESVNASGLPVAPVGGLSTTNSAWLDQVGGWVFASGSAGTFTAYPVAAASGALQAGYATTFPSSGTACTNGSGSATDGRTVWICGADGIWPISVVNPAAPVAGALMPISGATSIHYDGHLWVGGYAGFTEFDVSAGVLNTVKTYPLFSEVTGIAPTAGGAFATMGGGLWVTDGASARLVYQSSLRLSNPVVAGDLLYLVENGTLLAFDLTPWLVSKSLPVRLTPGAADAQALDRIRLWIDGPFAYSTAAQIWSGSYRAYDLR
jgi:hypothetical protein